MAVASEEERGFDETVTSVGTHKAKGAKVISHERASALVERLSKYEPRPEYLQTPGPYPCSTGNPRKIPFVFRTMQRFPPTPPAPQDALECNIDAISERQRNVIFTKEERFLLPPSATKGATVYEVEKGLRACEPKPHAILLPPHYLNCPQQQQKSETAKTPSRTSSPERLECSVPVSSFRNSPGGRISKTGTRDVYDFLVYRSASPGPIYSPSYAAVQGATVAVRFTTQARMPSPVQAAGEGSGSQRTQCCSRCSENAADDQPRDIQSVLSKLSTWTNAPVAAFGKPTVPFVNPNKVLSPPAPAEVEEMLERNRRKKYRPSSMDRLSGVRIRESVGDDELQDGGACAEQELVPTEGLKSDPSQLTSARRRRPLSSLSLRSASRPSSASGAADSRRWSPSRSTHEAVVALGSPFHALPDAAIRIVELGMPSASPQLQIPVHTHTVKRFDRPVSAGSAGASTAAAAAQPKSPTLAHPLMHPDDYFQLGVMTRVAAHVRGSLGASSHRFRKQLVPGGAAWTSSWRRGASAPRK